MAKTKAKKLPANGWHLKKGLKAVWLYPEDYAKIEEIAKRRKVSRTIVVASMVEMTKYEL